MTLPARKIETRRNPIEAFFENLRPRRLRSLREFAEREIIMPPGGVQAGMHFSCDFMPWTGLLLDEFDRAFRGASPYRRFFITADVQDGKTTLGIVIPLMYALFELRENVIFGAPNADMAQDKFEEEAKPMIEHSRFAGLMPKKGRSSRGGKSKTILFGNGVRLRFMGAGGGDEQRSAFTARVVFATEIDKMDEPGQVSRETDPVSQLEARTASFDNRALFFGECTLSTISGRTNREILSGTDTRIYIPCPHCGEYVFPERENFTGWQDAPDVLSAREKGHYVCQKCESPWTEPDRLTALQKAVLAARDQVVRPDGTLEGDPPRTNTFGFRWNAMLSAIKSQGYVAEKEWNAERSDDENPKKELYQYVWALPWDDSVSDLTDLSRDRILAKIGRRARGKVPEDAQVLTVFIDLGKWTCWWTAYAWRDDGRGYCVDYGAITVPQRGKVNPEAILAALRGFRDDYLVPGWVTDETGRQVTHKLCLVDSAWEQKVVYRFVRESGQRRFRAAQGLGSMPGQQRWKQPKKSKDRMVGNNWFISRQPGNIRLVNVNPDHWKRMVQDGFAAEAGVPGSLMLYAAPEREHYAFAYHILAEREVEIWDPKRGMVRKWQSIRQDNHWLDCSAGCYCAADIAGIRLKALREEQKTADTYRQKRPAPGARGRARKAGWKIGR